MEVLIQTSTEADGGGFVLTFKVSRKSGEGMEVYHLLFVNNTMTHCDVNRKSTEIFELGFYVV